MIVVGNSTFVENESHEPSRPPISSSSSLNWLLEREALIGIPPKQVKTFSLNLTDRRRCADLLDVGPGHPRLLPAAGRAGLVAAALVNKSGRQK